MNRKQQLFGNKLKELRIQKNLTQETFGDYAGVSANAIGQFERGIMYPNFETLYRIITALNVDANLFFLDVSSEYPYSARLFAETVKSMEKEEKITVSKFLSSLSHIISLTREDENIKTLEDDGM